MTMAFSTSYSLTFCIEVTSHVEFFFFLDAKSTPVKYWHLSQCQILECCGSSGDSPPRSAPTTQSRPSRDQLSGALPAQPPDWSPTIPSCLQSGHTLVRVVFSKPGCVLATSVLKTF